MMPQGLFPDMAYDQLYIEYQLPEGNDTRQVKSDLESMRKKLMAKDYVTHVTTSVGATPCRYNLVRSVALPSLAYGELIVDFKDARILDKHVDELQTELSADYPDAYVKVKRYNLMFMRYPIELRFLGSDPAVLHQLADTAMAIVRDKGIMEPVTSDWMPRYPTLHIAYNQPSARQKGITRSDVGLSLMSATDGLPVGVFYSGTERNNIYVNITDGKGQPQANLDDATVFSMLPDLNKITDKEQLLKAFNDGKMPQLTNTAQLAEVSDGIKIEWEEPVIPHYNGKRVQTVEGAPAPGYEGAAAAIRL